MRVFVTAISAAVLTFSSSVALAKKNTSQQSAALSTWYFNLGGLSDRADIDAVLKETRRGTQIVSAELDLCYLGPDGWTAIDRFVVPLTVKGRHLSGTGKSTEAGKPVAVSLKRSKESDGTTFEGTITYGALTRSIVSVGNPDVGAEDFESDWPERIFEKPADFLQATPDSVSVLVQRASFPGLIETLRKTKAKVELFSLRQTCRALRIGALEIELQVDPARAAAVVAALRSVPGVTRAGWSARGFPLDRSVRIDSAVWQTGGKLDKDKLGKALADIVGETFSTTSVSPSWDEVTGELTVTAQRPDRSIPGAGLTETISAYFVVSNEKPGASDMLVIRLGYVSSRLSDARPEPRLDLLTELNWDDTAEPAGTENILTGMAREFHGQLWDAEAAKPGWAN